MVIDNIPKMSIKGVKLKSESFFSISPGVLELWRKHLRGADSAPPGPDRVKVVYQITFYKNQQLTLNCRVYTLLVLISADCINIGCN